MTNSTAPAATSPLRAYYLVVLLMIAYMLSLMDRVMLGFLIEPVRGELGLGDTEIGLLLGFGFVLFYSLLGIPLGSLADRSNRRNLVVAGLLVWTIATAGTGLAGGFAGLLLARTLVGAGEATLYPCAVSMIGDSFPRERVGFALALYSLGGAFGIGIAMAVGGYLVEWTSDMSWSFLGFELTGWRLVFALVGLVGIPYAALLFATVREPLRLRRHAVHPPFSTVVNHMKSHKKAMFGLFGGFGAQVLSTYVPMLWAAAHFQRRHDLAPLDLGLAFALIFGAASGLAVLIGGALSDRGVRHGVSDAPARILFWAIPFQIPFIWLGFTLSDPTLALWMLGIQSFVASLYGGLQGAMMQILTPAAMHGRMMAIYLLAITVVGMGGGPLIVGALSEHLFTGNSALGLAMATTMTAALAVAALILTITRPAMRRCIAEVATQH